MVNFEVGLGWGRPACAVLVSLPLVAVRAAVTNVTSCGICSCLMLSTLDLIFKYLLTSVS